MFGKVNLIWKRKLGFGSQMEDTRCYRIVFAMKTSFVFYFTLFLHKGSNKVPWMQHYILLPPSFIFKLPPNKHRGCFCINPYCDPCLLNHHCIEDRKSPQLSDHPALEEHIIVSLCHYRHFIDGEAEAPDDQMMAHGVPKLRKNGLRSAGLCKATVSNGMHTAKLS